MSDELMINKYEEGGATWTYYEVPLLGANEWIEC